MESNLSTLVLENVSTNSSGTYGCRASNDYSAAVSSGGRVNIRGNLFTQLIHKSSSLGVFPAGVFPAGVFPADLSRLGYSRL